MTNPSHRRKALIAGATGLVGSALLKILASEGYYDRIYVPVRREAGLSGGIIEERTIDFDHLDEALADIHVHDVYCCLGTTMKKAGSKAAFYKVDHDYPLSLARRMYQNGAKCFLHVSALGADPRSLIFYNRVKGEVEQSLGKVGFESLVIFRPSLLLGDRQEKRAGEDIAKKVYKVLDRIFVGPLKKYAGIEGSTVARAMFVKAQQPSPGMVILESDEIRKAGTVSSQ